MCPTPVLRGHEFEPHSGQELRLRQVGKLPVTWDVAVVFSGYSGFLHQKLLASHDLARNGRKRDNNRNSKFQEQILHFDFRQKDKKRYQLLN